MLKELNEIKEYLSSSEVLFEEDTDNLRNNITARCFEILRNNQYVNNIEMTSNDSKFIDIKFNIGEKLHNVSFEIGSQNV